MDETMYATTDRTANNEQHGTIDHNGTSFQPEETHQFNYTQTNGKASNASHADSIDLPELDGDSTEPIAICGFSIKFPDDATDPESLWNMILERRCAVAKFPPSRFNSEGFFHKRNMLNTIPVQGGNFIKEDLSLFDAEFFSISPSEASAMDPMQRWLLETAYRALENAGISMSDVYGSSTAVYTGSFSMDYMLQLCRDPENAPKYTALGLGLSMLANRLSWFYNLRGPSIGLDTACSSSAAGIDLAFQALRNRSCDMSMVTGCNLAFSPEYFAWMTNLNFLSPDSRCYSFDSRANGYARGEGIGVIILKRLSDALRDGNTIRAVIRSAASNEDGRTPGITQPSSDAQERLIRETYRRAGLSMAHTRYFEAHGTGTPLGDPLEARAIGSAFLGHRSKSDPLYIGAIKSNIGHLEGASGIAGIVKAVLVLEKGLIPPNANFEKLNPRIDADRFSLKFPQQCQPWPNAGLRRASINSFGYGGANSHIVIDDAYNYLRLRKLSGRHCTVPRPPLTVLGPGLSHPNGLQTKANGNNVGYEQTPKLLIWSTADEKGLDRIADSYESFTPLPETRKQFLDDLAFTLDSRRSRLPWNSFAIVDCLADLQSLKSRLASPVQRRSTELRIGYVFTGQGAQWSAMGRELICYASFSEELTRASEYLKTLGCTWSVTGELLKSEEDTRIHDPEFSQTLCTVLQVALVNLLSSFGVRPSAVVGHSSGEIAAAYAGGHLSAASAWKLAYCRGVCSGNLSRSQSEGAMMVVTSSEDIIKEAVTDLNRFATSFGINVACYNSPKNVTVAGERHLIDQLMARLKETNTFARQLRLPIAYHSRQMCQVSQEYRSMIGTLSKPLSGASNLPMVSSVTGKLASSESLLDPSYWTTNMESPVLFSQAVINMYAGDSPDPGVENFQHLTRMVDHFVEIGPHSSLRSTLREILQASSRGQSIGYTSLLVRGQSATRTTSTAMGSLYSLGVPVNLRAVNEPSGIESSDRCLLVNLPEYPFDHSRGYWHESRLSRNYRLRRYAPSEFLGVRSRDWNTSEGRWRHFLKTTDIPWIEHHIINGAILYPAGGMLAMAIEAAKQMTQASSNTVVGYTLRDVQFQNPIDLTDSSRMVEVETSLRPLELPGNKSISYDFKINTYANDDYEVLNCHGYITVEVVEATSDWIDKKTRIQRRKLLNTCSNSPASEERSVDFRHMYSFLKQQCGFDYGPFFQVAEHQRYYNNGKQVSAEVRLFSEANEDHVIHPITLDAFFHLPLTAITSGGSQPTATSIPTHVDYLWVAATGLAFSSEQQTAKAFATVTEKTKRGFTCNGIGVSNVESDDVRLWYYGLKLTSITADPAAEEALPNPNQSFLNIDCKVCLDKLEPNEVHNLLNSRHPNNQDLSGFFQDLALLVEVSLDRFVRSVSFSASHSKDPWKPHFWNWAQHHCSEARRRERWDNPESEVREASANFESLLDRVGNSNPIGRLYVVVASNLVAFWNGSADPLELLMHSNLLKECYEHWNNNSSSMQISEYMDLLAHQNPGMNILEVGGGTGSGTRNLVAALSACSGERGGVLRCHRYDFTDVSASFFGQAKEEFNTFLSQMTFGVLDIERDWVEQEYASGFYDVVIAVSVVHISSHLEATIQRVRKALKPGGKFVMQEAFTPSGWTLSYVFGLFPGWWFGVGDDRVLSPSISISEWDTLLKANGFSGVDLVRDLGHEGTFHYGWIISTATEAQPLTLQPTACPNLQISILLDEGVPQQALFADALSSQINSWTSVRITRKNIQDPSDMVSHQRNSEEFVIFLADYSQSHIKSLNEVTWEVLRDLFGKLRRFLWITTGGGRLASPEYAMLDGLARTLRLEHEELHLVTLGLEEAGSSERQVSHAVRVLKEMTLRLDYQNYEQEYIEVDGLLHTRRLVEATYLKSAVDARVNPLACIPTRLDSSARFYAAMGITRSSKSPCYVPLADPEPGGPELDCVEVAVKAVALEGQDNPSTPARNENHKLGSSFAGIVTKSGTSSQFHPGNRVFGVHPDSLRSHVRLSSQSLTRIPAALAFSEACSLMPPFAIAFTALVEIGHVRSTDSILVHGGDTPVGLAALRLLLRQDVKDLWVTADDEISSHRVSEQLQIPWGRFLPRNWFSIFSMSASQWRRRFDVVFSAEETSPSILSLDHVRPGGRYVTLQYNSTLNKNADMQRIHGAPAGVTLSTIDPSVTILSQESLRFAAAMASSSNLALAREQAKLFPASSLPEAFDALRGLPGGEYAVIGFEEYDTIDIMVENKPKCRLDPEATYLIAGGLGGLGREMARWLASRGARNLVLLSRTGLRTPRAVDLISHLEGDGVRVHTPICDVTDAAALQSVLRDCSQNMPKIKGCIQASMVLKEVYFDQMTFGDWKAVTGPKVEGSWNLHAALPKGLDFFIMLSSVQGILGTGLLAAYNAGNTYQDSLARYRVVQGERAIAIDLGGVTDSGFLAENSRYDTIFKRNKKLSPLQLKELYALLDIACEPGNDTLYESVRSCQCIVGLSQPASWNLDEEPFTMSQPFWGHMHHVPLRGSGQVDSPDASGSTHAVAGRKQTVNLAEQLAAADSIEEVSTIILEALVGRVCSLLGTDSKRMDVNKSMQSHGIDSISAIDLRNWVIKAFDVDMPVFEFLGAGTFVGVAETIASKKGSNTTKALLGYLRQGEGLQSVSDPVDS